MIQEQTRFLPVIGVAPFVRRTPRDSRPTTRTYLAVVGSLLGLATKRLGRAAADVVAVPLAASQPGRRSLAPDAARQTSVRFFTRLMEAKDPYTARHTERVATYARYIAEETTYPAPHYERLRQSALLHDVGKLVVPNRLLNKPGRLTQAEFDLFCRRNQACVDLLCKVEFLRDIAEAASDRHARFDNDQQHARSDWVRDARVVAVADAFDAMTSTRAYRRALDQDVAFAELRTHAGTQFDPDCVEALIRAIQRRGERHGLGHETEAHDYAVPPPLVGVGSAGLGDLVGVA